MIISFFDFGDSERIAGKFAFAAQAGEPYYLRDAMYMIGTDMRRAERALFRSQGRRGGGSWAHLKDATIYKKGSSRILYTKGARAGYSSIGDDALYRSLSEMGSKYSVFTIFGYELEFGTSRPNAWVHEEGYPPKNIPARPFLKFTAGDVKNWNLIIQEHLMKSWMVVPFRERFG